MINKYIFGLDFCFQTQDEVAFDVLNCKVNDNFPMRLVITPNVDHIVTLHNNDKYKNACLSAWKLTVDGFPLQKFIEFVVKRNVPRVTGSDLFPKIMEGLNEGMHRPAFLVATDESSQYLKAWLQEKGFSKEDFYISVPPYGFESDDKYTYEVISELKKIHCSHLFMGVGAPKSEIWADSSKDSLKGICVLCFGAGIEFFTKQMVRAPKWMQRYGFEWLWRLLSEPKRLAKRYIVNSWWFLIYSTREYGRLRKFNGN